MAVCFLCSAAWLTFVPAAHPSACGRLAILSGRLPPAGLPLSLPSPLFAISGLPPMPGSLAAIAAKRLAGRPFRMLVSDDAVSFRSVRPHPVAILTAL